MATPQESITTFSGRRCTRSRTRTAASSILTSDAAAVTSTEVAPPVATTSEAQQIQSSSVAPPPPSSQPPPPPSSSAPPSEAAAPSTTGTDSPVVAQSALLANPAPPPAAAAQDPGAVVSEAAVPETVAAPQSSAVPTVSTTRATISTTSSDSNNAAATSAPSRSAVPSRSLQSSDSAFPIESSVQTATKQPQPSPQPVLPSDEQPNDQPAQPTSTEIPSGSSAGIIAPDQGPDIGTSLTIGNNGNVNIGAIAGGVVGGFAGVLLVSVLLFLCLRKRKTKEQLGGWRKRVSEKEEGRSALLAKLKGFQGKFAEIPAKLKGIPAGVGVMVAKISRKKSGPAENPYNRQSVRSSVSSIYSVPPNGRSRSISEPPSKLREQLRGFGDRMPSLKRSRTLLQKKPDSLVVGDRSPFPRIVEDPVLRNSKGLDNPFADPVSPLEAPKLYLLNPDPNSREGTPKPQRTVLDGLQDQQRGPISPKPVATSTRGSADPFASILDELEQRNGSGTPEWLRDAGHKRTQSATTALRSHPPSTYTASIYTTADNPFLDPQDVPPVPNQPLPPNPPRRPSNAYTAGLPTFNATSSAASRESNGSFFLGEPGPSRPSTNMFSDVSVLPRIGRQSDPFDLDRPEVLGFGQVGGRTVRASVTRQNSKSMRNSTVPNYVNVNDGPYERTSAVPGPLRNPSIKR